VGKTVKVLTFSTLIHTYVSRK